MNTENLIAEAQVNAAAGQSIVQIAREIVRKAPEINDIELVTVLKASISPMVSFATETVDQIVTDAIFYARPMVTVRPQMTPSQLAVALRSEKMYPLLTALQMGQVLMAGGVFPNITAPELQKALTDAGYSTDDVSAALAVLFPQREPQSYVFEVQASAKWQVTPATVRADEVATITYQSGSWQVSSGTGMVDARGNSYFIAKPGYMLPGSPEGMLVALLDRTVFAVGNQATTPASKTGALYLASNDDEMPMYGAGYADNFGSITVKIEVRPIS